MWCCYICLPLTVVIEDNKITAAHIGAMGITPSCCVLCLHRNVVIHRSKLLTSVSETNSGTVSFVAHVGAQRTSYSTSVIFLMSCNKLAKGTYRN